MVKWNATCTDKSDKFYAVYPYATFCFVHHSSCDTQGTVLHIFIFSKRRWDSTEPGWYETELRGSTHIRCADQGSPTDWAGASIIACRTPRISSPLSQGKPQFQDPLLETYRFASLACLIWQLHMGQNWMMQLSNAKFSITEFFFF